MSFLLADYAVKKHGDIFPRRSRIRRLACIVGRIPCFYKRFESLHLLTQHAIGCRCYLFEATLQKTADAINKAQLSAAIEAYHLPGENAGQPRALHWAQSSGQADQCPGLHIDHPHMLDTSTVGKLLAKASTRTGVDAQILRVPRIGVLRVPPRTYFPDQDIVNLRWRRAHIYLVLDQKAVGRHLNHRRHRVGN